MQGTQGTQARCYCQHLGMLIFVPTGVAKLPKAQTREDQLVALRRQHQRTLLELMGTPPLTPGEI